MIAAGLLFMAGALLLGFNMKQTPAEAPSPVPTFAARIPALATIDLSTSTTSALPRVTLEKAKQAFDDKTAVFVDVRDTGSYADNHIPGALSIPVGDLQSRLNELKKTDWIITYCT